MDDKLEFNPPNTEAPAPGGRETVGPRSAAEGAPPAAPQDRPAAASGTNKPMIISILYIASVVVGLTGLVAFILALVWKGEAHEAWEDSHYDYHIRTFLIWICAFVVGFLLIFTVIGIILTIFLWIGATILVLVRGIISLLKAQERQPMPNPETWLA